MTRLTDAQIREAREFADTSTDTMLAWRTAFAHRIAALAVQEVERERDDWRTTAMSARDERDDLREYLNRGDERRHELAGECQMLRAQLAEVTKERDTLAKTAAENFKFATDAHKQRDALTAQLATAKREGFVAGSEWYHSPKMDVHAEARSRYPATPSGETKCADVAGCDGKCCATPSPEAREVPEDVRVYVERKQHYPQVHDVATGDWVTITPADAKRIGILGGWRDA
jgi:hypothetical protein